jgi:hypothetical protein
MSAQNEVPERRKRQRFLTTREGGGFGVQLDGKRLQLQDLSLEGFAVPVDTAYEAGQVIGFVLEHDGSTDQIAGTAHAVNFVTAATGPQAGCLFDSFEGEGRALLESWLTAHVFEHAWVPITEQDAKEIVTGPSLI